MRPDAAPPSSVRRQRLGPIFTIAVAAAAYPLMLSVSDVPAGMVAATVLFRFEAIRPPMIPTSSISICGHTAAKQANQGQIIDDDHGEPTRDV